MGAAVPLVGAVAGPILGKVLGGGSKKQSTTTQELPPHIKAAQEYAFSRGKELSNQPYTPYEGERFAGFNPMQTNAMGSANLWGQMGVPALGHGYNALTDMTGMGIMGDAAGGLFGMAGAIPGLANEMMNFDPIMAQQVAAQQGRAMFGKASTAEAALANRDAIRNLEGGSYLDMNINDYMNPFVDSVVGDVKSDFTRLGQQQDQLLRDQANAAGAFGGSRHGVQGAVQQAENQRNFGQLSNNLRSQAYDAATGLMGDDLKRALEAGVYNQNMDWNTQNLNATLGTDVNKHNASLQTDASLRNAMIGTDANLRNAMMRNEVYGANADRTLMADQSNLEGFLTGGANALQGLGYGIDALKGAGVLGQNMGALGLDQGKALTDFARSGFAAQMGAGDKVQGLEQAQRDFDFGQFQEARDWENNRFQTYLDTLRASGPGGAGTTTQDYFGPSYLQQAMGGAQLAQGIYGMGQNAGWWGQPTSPAAGMPITGGGWDSYAPGTNPYLIGGGG